MPDERNVLGPDRGVAVFGAHDAEPGSEAWRRAAALGRELGARRVAVVTGGYGGVMEAASRAAREAGGEAVGVTCRAFRGRQPNPWLTLEIEEPDLHARTARLFALGRGFVVLEGGAGTLAELALLWAQAKAGAAPGPIVIWDDPWAALFEGLVAQERLEPRARRATRVAQGPEDAVRMALEDV